MNRQTVGKNPQCTMLRWLQDKPTDVDADRDDVRHEVFLRGSSQLWWMRDWIRGLQL